VNSFYEWHDNDIVLRLKVQPKSSKDEVCEVMGDCLKVRITAPPIDGKANQHLIKYLAKLFKVSKSRVTLISGESHREKRFKISAPGQLPEFITPA